MSVYARGTPEAAERDAALCRLLRADGTEWRVTGLQQVDEGLEVDAVHFAVPTSPVESGGRSVPVFRRLEGELLERGDLLQWLGPDGEVLWSMAPPARPLRA